MLIGRIEKTTQQDFEEDGDIIVDKNEYIDIHQGSDLIAMTIGQAKQLIKLLQKAI